MIHERTRDLVVLLLLSVVVVIFGFRSLQQDAVEESVLLLESSPIDRSSIADKKSPAWCKSERCYLEHQANYLVNRYDRKVSIKPYYYRAARKTEP